MDTSQKFHHVAGLQANQAKSQLVCGGCDSTLWEKCLEVTGYHEGALPMQYLGVPITASKLSKLECRTLVEKIFEKIRQWSTKSLSFTGRAQLINSVIFDMYSF